MGNSSLEFVALQEEEIEENDPDLGEMDVADSALDMLGEAEQAVDDIEAKMDME